MSNGVFGSASSSSSSSSSVRVSIPGNVRKTIDDIREITGKLHSDDEIYAVLKECSMDPNETIQKLMYLDTFHEVKRRRERKKETVNGKATEERPPVVVQRRGYRGGSHGNYASNFSSGGGGRNFGRRGENGPTHYSHRARNNSQSRAARASSTALPNGTLALPDGHDPTIVADSEVQSLADVSKFGPGSPEPAASGVSEQEKSDEIRAPVNSSVDSLPAPSLLGPYSYGATAVEHEVGNKPSVDETSHVVDESKADSNRNVGSGEPETEEFVDEEAADSFEKEKLPSKPSTPETSEPLSIASREVVSEVAAITAQVGSLSTKESNISNGQHVTFPNHFRVPEALKSGLTFGSFDVAFGPAGESLDVNVENEDVETASQDSLEAAKEPTPSDQNVASVEEGCYLDNSQSLTHSLSKIQPSKCEQPKQEAQFLPDNHQNHIISVPNYLGLLPHMVGNQLVSYEGLETQAHDSRIPMYANGNAMVPPSTNPSPPLPTSIAVTPQSLPVYRQTYPPNFFPYGQYISPFYIPQMHQYIGHNGFAPQPGSGNVYLPQAAPGAGVKFSLPQFKPGNAGGNPTHIGIQPAGSYITGPVSYAQSVTSGTSMGNDELIASHLKESQIYTTGQLQTEGTGVWIHSGAGQEMPTFQMNSMYNLAPPPQPHITYTPHQQTGHAGGFAAMFPPGHAMTAPSTLLQQSQAASAPGGPIEAIGPPAPSGAPTGYQQHQQMSWNSAF